MRARQAARSYPGIGNVTSRNTLIGEVVEVCVGRNVASLPRAREGLPCLLASLPCDTSFADRNGTAWSIRDLAPPLETEFECALVPRCLLCRCSCPPPSVRRPRGSDLSCSSCRPARVPPGSAMHMWVCETPSRSFTTRRSSVCAQVSRCRLSATDRWRPPEPSRPHTCSGPIGFGVGAQFLDFDAQSTGYPGAAPNGETASGARSFRRVEPRRSCCGRKWRTKGFGGEWRPSLPRIDR